MLKYVVTAFLLPPGAFVLLLALLGVREIRGRRGTGAALLGASALLWALSVSPVSDRLLAGLERAHPVPPPPGGDAIVLLGGGIHEEATDLTGTGTLADEVALRIVDAARLHRRTGLPVVCSGGNPSRPEFPEARVLRRILVDLGVPADRIVAEEESRTTRENALRTAALCRERGFRRPYLVTSAFHMPRAVSDFARAGLAVIPAPAGRRTWEGKRYRAGDILPNAATLRASAIALRERIGLLAGRFY